MGLGPVNSNPCKDQPVSALKNLGKELTPERPATNYTNFVCVFASSW